MTRQRGWAVPVVLAAVLVTGGGITGCTTLEDAAEEARSPSPTASDPPAEDGAGPGPALPGLPSAERARSQLSELKVAPSGPMTGYARSAFSHWSQQGERCDTREAVLERDGKDVTRDDECRAVSGTWYSAFDGERFDDPSELDIDHVVPLANAWRSGARGWDDEKRKEFANDLQRPQLIAVSASSNRSKGDQSPDQWQPPVKDYWCTYGRAWTGTKEHYGLTVTEPERDMLSDMLDTCTS